MNTRIIAITQPLLSKKTIDFNENQDGIVIIDENTMSVDEFIAYVARVSNPSNQNNTLTAPKLLEYLAKNKHWSPFELANIVMEINTTRDIARQILRHRSFSFQEFSQRYANVNDLGSFHIKEARLQDNKNRQNSIEIDDINYLNSQWKVKQAELCKEALETYNWAIQNGLAKEVARVVLPEGLTPSRMYMNGSLRSWITYIALREKNGTQKEHRLIAKECKANILEYFPSLEMLSDENGEWIV